MPVCTEQNEYMPVMLGDPRSNMTQGLLFDDKKPTMTVGVNQIYEHVECFVEPGTGCMNAGVFVVRRQSDGKLLIEKRLKTTTQNRRKRARDEIRVLTQIKNNNGSVHLNRIVDQFRNGNAEYGVIILDFCMSGTLEQQIGIWINAGVEANDNYAWHILAGLSKALCFLHTGRNLDGPDGASTPASPDWNAICHLDIKPSNIFLDKKRSASCFPLVVLGDFGCAVTRDQISRGKVSRTTQLYGTPGWLPPENNRSTTTGAIKGPYGVPTDIWRTGGVVQAVCRKLEVPNQLLAEQKRPCGRTRFSEQLNFVVTWMMEKQVTARPTAMDVARIAKQELEGLGLPF